MQRVADGSTGRGDADDGCIIVSYGLRRPNAIGVTVDNQKRLSWLRRSGGAWVLGLSDSDDCIDDGEQFAHIRGEGNLYWGLLG